MRWGWWLVLPAWTATLWGAVDFAGAAACAECHADQVRRQSATRHARALRPILSTELPALLAREPLRERGGAALEYRVTQQGLAAIATVSNQSAEALLEWAFGAGAQGVTPVGRVKGRYVEHRISYYTQPQQAGLTLGHSRGASRDASSALGLLQDPATIYRCFNCHATNVQPGVAAPDLSRMQAGVVCERCHGPGSAHIAAAREKRSQPEIARAILNAGRYPAKAVVQICGECHRAPSGRELSPAPEVDDPINVRFQPLGFLVSKCFLGSKSFSCLTCHDPHEDARRHDDRFYSAKCLGCHATKTAAQSRCGRSANQNCLPCHMRRTSPAPHLTFTDHRIRMM